MSTTEKISVGYVERKYSKLLYDVKHSEFYNKTDLSNRINCYVCNLGHITKTKDVDSGVTPFSHVCETCGTMAKSTMYTDVSPEKNHTQEWYRPTLKQVLKLRKNPNLLDHVLNGGLLNRKIQP